MCGWGRRRVWLRIPFIRRFTEQSTIYPWFQVTFLGESYVDRVIVCHCLAEFGDLNLFPDMVSSGPKWASFKHPTSLTRVPDKGRYACCILRNYMVGGRNRTWIELVRTGHCEHLLWTQHYDPIDNSRDMFFECGTHTGKYKISAVLKTNPKL